jgi:hypothetical protein
MRSERESRDSSGDRRISNTSPGCHHGRSAVLLICLGGQPCLVSFPCTVATPTNAEALRQVLSTQSEVESRSHVQVLAWPLPIPLPLPLALPMPIFPLPPSPFPLPRHSALLPSPLPLLRLCLFSVRRVSCVLAGVCGVSAHGRCSCHPGLSYRARFADLELAVALEVCSWRLSVDPRRTRACG